MKLKPKKLPTLLLVSDAPSCKTFFEMMTEKLDDYALICTNSSSDALEYLSSTFISCIVIDEKTPHIELIPLCEKIRASSDLKHTPILIITGHLKKSFTRSLMKAGATDFLLEPLDEDEFIHRMEIANDIMETEQKIIALTTRFARKTSPSPTLDKRTIIDNRATEIIKEALSQKKPLSLLLLEIDQFQQFKKDHGESHAHAVLIHFEDQLQKLMRGQDLLFNQKEGKFAVFLPRTSDKGSQFIAENIQESLEEETFSVRGTRFNFTISIGVATLDKSGDSTKDPAANMERLMKAAGNCLKEAQKKGNTSVSQSKMGDQP